MTISQLARRAQVGTETIRFYEREGLLAQPRKPVQGYRQYAAEHLERVLFIKQCQSWGFSLAEARMLLDMLASGEASCETACDLAERKIGELRRRIGELEELKLRLESVLRQPCDGKQSKDCVLLESLRVSGVGKTSAGSIRRQ